MTQITRETLSRMSPAERLALLATRTQAAGDAAARVGAAMTGATAALHRLFDGLQSMLAADLRERRAAARRSTPIE